MKKIITIFSALMCFSVALLFAQNNTETKQAFDLLKSEEDSLTRDIVPERQHTLKADGTENKTAKVRLEYTPITGEVRLYYTCLAVTFDAGDAMNTALAVYEDFATDNQYKHYKYMQKDKTRYYKDENGLRMAEYRSYVVFTR